MWLDPTNTGFVVSTGLTNGFDVDGSAFGTNSPEIGSGNAGMDLSHFTISSTGIGTVILYLTQNDLSAPLGSGTLSETLTGSFQLGGSGTVSMVAYGNDTNDLYGYGENAPEVDPSPSTYNVTTGSVGLGGSASTGFTSTAPYYSLTEILTIDFTSAGQASISSTGDTTFSLPTPTGLLLVLSGSPVLALGYFLRRRKAVLAA